MQTKLRNISKIYRDFKKEFGGDISIKDIIDDEILITVSHVDISLADDVDSFLSNYFDKKYSIYFKE